MIGRFDLPAVVNGLRKNAVFIAQAEPMPGISSVAIESRKHAANRPETAIAETGIRFLFDNFERINFLLFAEFAEHRVKQEVGDIVGQGATNQEFQRQIIDPFDVASRDTFPRS